MILVDALLLQTKRHYRGIGMSSAGLLDPCSRTARPNLGRIRAVSVAPLFAILFPVVRR